MSPIRTKPFRTRSAGQQTTKVLDGKCRVFPSTIDAGGFAIPRRDASELDLSVRFLNSNNWYRPNSTSAANYMVGFANRISGYSTNQSNSSEGYFIVAVNKMCRIYYSFTISSENNYDEGLLRLSQKSGPGTTWGNNVSPYTGSQVNWITPISGEVTVNSYADMIDVANYRGENYDIGIMGEHGEMMIELEYDKDGSAASGSDTFTVNYIYVVDIPYTGNL